MDDFILQRRLMRHYQLYLIVMYDRLVSEDEAGIIWCKRCAELFRNRH